MGLFLQCEVVCGFRLHISRQCEDYIITVIYNFSKKFATVFRQLHICPASLCQAQATHTGATAQRQHTRHIWQAVAYPPAQHPHRHNSIIQLWALPAPPMISQTIRTLQAAQIEIVYQVSRRTIIITRNKNRFHISACSTFAKRIYKNLKISFYFFFLSCSAARLHGHRLGSALEQSSGLNHRTNDTSQPTRLERSIGHFFDRQWRRGNQLHSRATLSSRQHQQ